MTDKTDIETEHELETSGELPPLGDPELSGISERLHDYNQTVQEQAFLLGYRNGFREGDMVQGLLAWIREASTSATTPERREALQDVEHWLVSNGAYPKPEGEPGEVTHPPGLNLYLGAGDGRPHVQVAGERIPVQELDLVWEPAPGNDQWEQFEPQAERGRITIECDVELPEESESRLKLMEFLQGIR